MIEINPALPHEQPILENLLELYAHDFSEFLDLELGPDGRFGYKDLLLYWLEPDRRPFLIRVDGKLAGLAMVKRAPQISSNETVWDMAEFFIIRGYRRRGIGMHAADQVWRLLRGLWQVRVMESNRSALEFWERAIAAFTGEIIPPNRIEKDGTHWRVFSFESTHVSARQQDPPASHGVPE